MRRNKPAEPAPKAARVVTITISMPRRLLRQVTRLRKHYCYPTMSEYVRERLIADLRLPSLAAPAASQQDPESKATAAASTTGQ